LHLLGRIGRVLFVLIVIGPVLLLWLPASRVPRIRRLIALVLVGLIAVTATLVHFLPRAGLEITLIGLLLALSAVLAGHLMGPRQARAGWPTVLLAGWLSAVLCLGAIVLKPEPFFPATDLVLPLPPGLAATVDPYGDGACGTGSCSRTITVTGRPGQSGDDLRAELKRHVEARGWGTGCRPAGWLLDRTTACVELHRKDDRVTIVLSGDRDDVRELVTLD
jgi:hypothetical protein